MKMKILETQRTILRELTKDDSYLNPKVLNEPSFINYSGDRGIGAPEQSIGSC